MKIKGKGNQEPFVGRGKQQFIDQLCKYKNSNYIFNIEQVFFLKFFAVSGHIFKLKMENASHTALLFFLFPEMFFQVAFFPNFKCIVVF